MGGFISATAIIAFLIACYAIPSFIVVFFVVLIHAAITRKTKGMRSNIKIAARLTPHFTVIFFMVLHGLQFISKPDPPVFENVSVDNFRLSQYSLSYGRRLQESLETIFPVGTSKKYIDSMLIDREGAKITETSKTSANYHLKAWPWTCFPMSGKTDIKISAGYDDQLNIKFWLVSYSPTNGCSYF